MTTDDRYNYAFDPDGDAWAARLLRQVPEGATVLELGPGPGSMTRVLLGRQHVVTVVENFPEALAELRALDVQLIESDLDAADWSQPLAGQRFDAILACDVLEHLLHPDAVLRTLKDHMASNGRLIVSIPNVAYAGVLAALRMGRFDYDDKGLLDRTHLRFYTRRSIDELLQAQGWYVTDWQANRVPLVESEFAWIWQDLPAAQRQVLSADWPDFDVYQWMAVATPMADSVAAEIGQARAELAAVHDELQALRLRHEVEHASLLEHQKAFSQARQTIGDLQRERDQLQAAVRQMQKEMGQSLGEMPPATDDGHG